MACHYPTPKDRIGRALAGVTFTLMRWTLDERGPFLVRMLSDDGGISVATAVSPPGWKGNHADDDIVMTLCALTLRHETAAAGW